MKKPFKIAIGILLALCVIAWLGWFIASHEIAVLEPKGWVGEKERDLIITSSLLMLIVVVPVLVLTGFFAWKYRASNKKSRHEPNWEHNYIAEYCWWGVPCVIILILAVLTWKSSHELNPFKPLDSDVKTLNIQVVSLQWKWLFIYPEQGIATINFVQFPEKTPIYFEITSDAPMNSFWIPSLGGQIYTMPAMRSKLYLMAKEAGSYRGSSANISGDGFAGMVFVAKSSSNADFDQWVQSVRGSGKHLSSSEYEKLVEPTQYVPASFYVLDEPQLFDQIMKKYTEPQK